MSHVPSSPAGAPTPPRPLSPWKVWLPPLLILAAAGILALASARGYSRGERAGLDRESRRIETGVEERLRDYEFLLRGGLGLLNNSAGDITAAQWRAYVDSLDYADFFPDAQGLGYAPRVTADGLARHLRQRRSISAGYEIFPSGVRADYFPVAYFAPANSRNQRVIGFDMGSDSLRRAAIARARDTGEASLTGKVTLARATGESAAEPSCLLIVPVYRQGAPTDTVAARRAALRGVLCAPFRIKSLLTELLGAGGAPFGVAVYDGPTASSESLLYSNTRDVTGQAVGRTSVRGFYGRQWTFVFTQPRPGIFSAGRREPLVLMLLGVMLSAAVWLIVRNIDVTRARAEALAAAMTAELRQSEAYNRTVYQQSSMPIAVCGPDDHLLDVNPAMLDLLGYTREEFLGLFWQDIIHPDDWEENARLTGEALAGRRESYRLELRAVDKSRRPVWGQLNVGLVRGEDGAVRFFIGALKDISERKAAEAARAEHEALYEAMFENNRAVCLLVDPRDGRIVDANRAAAEYYGYTRDELRTMPAADGLALLAPDALGAKEDGARACGGLSDFVHRLRDGSLRNVRVHSGPFESGGRTLLLCTVQDVTEQARAEAALAESRERFRDLVESTDQGVVLNDEDEAATYVNPAFGRLMGCAPEELVGRPVSSFLTEEGARIRREQQPARRAGSRAAYETHLIRPDGGERLVRIMPFPLYDAGGAFRGSCGLVADITGEHAACEAENQRQVRRAALLRLHEMQGASRQEFFDSALDEALKMTGSQLGYIGAYDEASREFTVHAWSEGVMDACGVRGAQTLYRLEQTGVWGDVVRQGAPVLLNDFAAPHPGKRGLPEGHAPLTRFLSVPVIHAGRVRAVLGVANKINPYTEEDSAELSQFVNGVWSILERQDAERELRALTERLQRAARAGRVGLWEWDLETGEAYYDAMMAELFGLDEAAAAERSDRTGTPEDWLCRVAREDREAVRAALLNAAAKGERFAAAFRVRKPGGEEAYMEASAEARLDADGRPLRMAGVHIDVTPLRLAEQKLAQSLRFLQTLIDSLPHTVFCKDAEGRFLLVNQAYADMRGGRPLEEYLGKRTEDVEPPEHAGLHREWDACALAAGPGNPVSYEYDRTLPAGGVEHRMVFKSLVSLPGGGVGIVGINVDNTQRKQAEERLAQSEERFRHLFENAPIAYQSLDEDGRLLLVNAAWLDALGYTEAEVLGRPFTDFMDPDSRPLFREQFARFLREGVVRGAEYLLRGRDGARHLISANGRVARNCHGRSLCTHCTFQDITERRAAEDRLARSHRFLQNLIDSLPTPFVCKDAQGRYLLVNESFASLHRLTQGEILGRSIGDFGMGSQAELHVACDAAVLSGQGGMQYEANFAAPGEKPRHWLVSKAGIALDDGGAGVAALAIDITERKQAELALTEQRRRLSDVIEGSGTGVWEWDIGAGTLRCNERWAQILGLPGQELTALPMEEFLTRLHPDDRVRRQEALARHLSGETPFFDLECRLRHEDGQWVWVHTRGRVFKRDEDGAALLMSGAMTDVSARKLAEERLELVARFPVENPHPVLRADESGALLYANPAAEVLLAGWGQKVGGALPVELKRELDLALASGQARTSERSYPSGVYSFTLSPFMERGYVNIYAVDETQRKAAEMALRLGELRYRELAVMLRLMCDNVPDMIWAKDMENRYLFANKALCERYLCLGEGETALGRTEEHYGRREQLAHPDDPDWHTIWSACAASDEATLKADGPRLYEEAGFCQGRFMRYEVSKAPFVNDEGVVIGTVGSARDITERRAAEQALARSEERFRTLAQVSPVGIFQADAQGRCTYVNDQWMRISGYPRQAALGRGWLRTLAAADRRDILRGLRETARTGDDFITELRFRPAKGLPQGRWALVRAAVERGPEGVLTGFAGAVTDITEIKSAEAALRRAKVEAEAATQAKALFLANMSHEIRTPLAGVIGTTRLLAQSRLDEAQRRLAEMAVDSGQALLEVVNDILDFSKIEAGRLTLRRAPFRLRRMLDSITGPIAVLGRERGLTLGVAVGRNAPDALVGDEGRLGQVLRNLLTNAFKFTETGGITVTVRAESRSKEAARLSFSVADTGCGIDPSYLPHLFESFSQGDSSYGKRHGGTGLGLAISKSLVEQMGGSIQVLSTLGKGSTFTVTLPFELEASASAEPPRREEAVPAAAAAAGEVRRPLRVLLADDNAIGRVLMEHVLQNAGHRVKSVADGQEVLRALREGVFDLVLMDVQMPRLDGVSATRQLRRGAAGEAARNIAVVALTAYTSGDDRRNFFEAGMDDAVSKPTEEKALFAAMERALAAAAQRGDAITSAATPAGHAGGKAAAPQQDAGGVLNPASLDRLDHAYLTRSFGDNLSLLSLLLRQFKEKSLPEAERGLNQALDSRDLRRCRATAHRARGMLSAVGAARGAAIAAEAERAAAAGDAARFAEMASALRVELDALSRHLLQGLPWGPLSELP